MPIGTGAAILGSSAIGAALGASGGARLRDRKIAKGYIDRAQTGANALLDPYAQAGQAGLDRFQQGIDNQTPIYDEFKFNLEADQGFNFARDQAMQETERAMAARGYNNSGNLFAELTDRATGEGQRYANDAFNRQMGQWSANAGRNQDIYGRDQNALGQWNNLAQMGQQAATGQANNVMQRGLSNANIRVGAANAGMQNNQFQTQSLNNMVQGGIQNYLVDKYLGNQGGSAQYGGNALGGYKPQRLPWMEQD